MGTVGQRIALLMGGTAAGLVMATSAMMAQETNEREKTGRITVLQRLVVGAGAEKVAIDTPQAVTVVEQQDIELQQPTTVGDVFDQIPGVSTSGSERVLGETFNIRGIGAPESAGDEGRIIVNVDGINKFYEQYRLGGFFSDPELYKRIEVLRGPASSTLYGAGALGGVINFTTKDASDFIEEGQTGALRLKSSYDSNSKGALGSVILAQKIDEQIEFLFAGNYRDYSNYTTGNGSVVNSEFKAPSGLAKATYRFGDGNEQAVRISYQHWTTRDNDQPYAQVTTSPGFGTIDRQVTDKTAIISYENPAGDNDWIDLKIQASFSDTTNKQTDSRSAAGVPNRPVSIFQDTTYGYKTWQFGVENTIDTTGENYENHLTFGLQFAHQSRSVDVRTPFGFHPQGTDVQTGLFVQNEFVWNENLTIIPGARIDFQRLTPDATVPGAGVVSDVAFSPKLAALYKVNDYFSVFGSYAHTERFPTLDEIFSNDFSGRGRPNYSLGLKKERSDNFELGFAVSGYDLLTEGDALQLKTTVFHNNVTDYIERRRRMFPQYRNTGHAVLYGGEVELAYESDYVFGSAGYSLIRGENRAPISASNPNGFLNTVAPDELFMTVGGRLPEHGLSFGWKSRFIAAQNRVVGTATSRQATPSIDVHDLFATWIPQDGPFAGFESQFGIENIFNKQYREYLSNDPAKGRTFKISLVKKLGW